MSFRDDFEGPDLDRSVWIPHYLPQWSSRAESAATYEVAGSELRLSIPPGQGLWCPVEHEGPLRVSGIQSGVFSGEVGSTVGQQPFRDGLRVREVQPAQWGWTPHYGVLEVRARMELTARSMASVWMAGIEDEPQRSGEICVFEVFGDAIDRTGPAVGMGIHPFRDPALRDDFATPRLPVDVTDFHVYAADWRPGRVDFFVDGDHVRTVEQAPDYPMQMMIGVFDFPMRPAAVVQAGHVPLVVIDYAQVAKSQSLAVRGLAARRHASAIGCAMLSNRQQVARLRHLAVQALGAYPLVAPELRFIAHGENTTFRVDAMAAGGRDRFLLRVHRPARHGQRLDSAAAIGSELDWLTALRAETGLSVPEPFRTASGELTTAAASPDVPEPRVCSLLRWMDGRVHSSVPRPVHLRRLGSVMARLHNHAGQWRPPPGFARIRWDWETFFGDTMVYGGINAADVWDLIPGDLRRRFDRVASAMQRVMTQLGDGTDQVGLIHADLHLDNALFWRDDVRIIDFDDCGFGYWLYDIAVSLWELRHRDDYEQFRAALIEGYTQHRPLPPGGLTHLDDFIATREVAFGLWYAGTAEVNPAFQGDLSEVLGHIGHSLDTLLGD